MPNKVAFQPLLDDLTDEARVIGAVNTAFIRLMPDGRRRYIGTNTDCVGIRETIPQRNPYAVSNALWAWFRPSEIYIVNRLKSDVNAIVNYF